MIPSHSRLARVALFALSLAAVAAHPCTAQNAPHATLSGLTYTIHATRHQQSQSAQAPGGGIADASWTGVVTWAAGRGRMDVDSGGMGGMYQKGDYVLFDSTTYIVVRPSVNAFYIVAPVDKAVFASRGISLTFSDAKASLERLSAVETIAGHPTRHFRSQVSYTMQMRAAALPPGSELPPSQVTLTTDTWYAADAHAPPLPFTDAMSELLGPLAPMMPTVARAVRRARSGLPTGLQPLRTTIASRTTSPVGMDAGFQLTYEATPARPAQVDPSKLVLPAGIHEAPMPGAAQLTGGRLQSPDDGAKWRKPPAAR